MSKLLVTLIAALLLVGMGDIAHARKGLAAYHLHTSRMVTASRYEPHGSILQVTNPKNGKSITVTVNDRGPFNGNRILDLSTGAFKKLFGSLRRGVGAIEYKVLRRGYGRKNKSLALQGLVKTARSAPPEIPFLPACFCDPAPRCGWENAQSAR